MTIAVDWDVKNQTKLKKTSLRLTAGVTVLCPCLVLVQPRKTENHTNITKKLLTEMQIRI